MRKPTPRSSRALRALGTLLLAAALGGCASGTYRTSLQLGPENAAMVGVNGHNPFLAVTNRGPGPVGLTFSDGSREPLLRGTHGRTMGDGGTVRIETNEEPAEVAIEAQRATGFSVQRATPKR